MKILTFDIEEWFHILDNASTKSIRQWGNYESRIENNMNIIFDYLDASGTKATFFVVGWIAEKYPEIVKKIDARGFEIGSHTHLHQLMYTQTPKQVSTDLENSISILESITGKKVISFRAPGFSITESNKWVFEILSSNGIIFDSSIFPSKRAHGGFQNFPFNFPCKIIVNGSEIREFPINTIPILGNSLIFSGGGYFRLTPYTLIKKWTQNSDYIMSYFHPRDFDYNQPVIKELSLFRKFKSYVGIKSCMPKLMKWSSDFEFLDLKEADKLIDWERAPYIEL